MGKEGDLKSDGNGGGQGGSMKTEKRPKMKDTPKGNWGR